MRACVSARVRVGVFERKKREWAYNRGNCGLVYLSVCVSVIQKGRGGRGRERKRKRFKGRGQGRVP